MTPSPFPWSGNDVALLGLGSEARVFADALRRVDPDVRLVGIESDPVRGAQALAEGWLSRVEPSGDALAGDLPVLVMVGPLHRLPKLLAAVEGGVGAETLITDALPLHAPVLRGATQAGLEGHWVTASPLPGGMASLEDPEGCPVSLAAHPEVSPALRTRAEAFWAALGGVSVWEEAHVHDARMAWVSHVPQLVATALAGALHAAGIPKEALGGEARALVALAAADPAPWGERLGSTGQVTGTGVTSVQRALGVVADLLARGHVERIVEFMDRAHQWATDTDEADSDEADSDEAESDTEGT
jgi:prephenate dehydrogenase